LRECLFLDDFADFFFSLKQDFLGMEGSLGASLNPESLETNVQLLQVQNSSILCFCWSRIYFSNS